MLRLSFVAHDPQQTCRFLDLITGTEAAAIYPVLGVLAANLGSD